MNLILATDSYKVSHHKQYPKGTTNVYSYFESRGGQFNDVVFFGLQYFLLNYLQGVVITREDIDEAKEYFALHFGNASLFNLEGWEYILEKHGGRLPVSIKAVAEGSVVPVSNVLMTVENTDPKCYWLTNYLETLLVQVWYPSTVATLSREMKRTITEFAEETGDPSLVNFKLHDFGFRGVSSVESATIGGMAHLVNFMGTDTMAALVGARKFYGAQMAGFSIPAAEHSTITSWGKEHEVDAFANMLDQYPEGLVAVVSDSFDIYNACSELWGKQLKDRVINRNGTVIIRPDSGYPPEVVVQVLYYLSNAFGSTENEKGYKVLDPHVRVIQGDGVDYDMCHRILTNMKVYGWSTDNIAFGMGGGLLQKLHRDTQKFAFKCSSVTVNGEEREVFKQPITDPGKNSKKGRLMLIQDEEGYATISAENPPLEFGDQLIEVFRDGVVLKQYTFDEIRERAVIAPKVTA